MVVCGYCKRKFKNQRALDTHHRYCKKRYEYLEKEIEKGNLFPRAK